MDGADAELTAETRRELESLYEGLRVTDVVDGLDHHGFHDIGQMSTDIRPLHRDVESFSHRAMGFAYTVRFHPTNRRRDLPHHDDLDFETFSEWKGDWYGDLSHEPDPDRLTDGDLIVIEAHGLDVGFVGSNNSLTWFDAGAEGVVTNAGARDTDELIKQGFPVYTKQVSKTIRPGRLETDDVQIPVNVGECLVEPGDVVVADGDGVVVVPLDHAREVAEAARRVQKGDQRARRSHYESMGLEPDFTLEQPERFAEE